MGIKVAEVRFELMNNPKRWDKIRVAASKGRRVLYETVDRQTTGACAALKVKLTAEERSDLCREIVRWSSRI